MTWRSLGLWALLPLTGVAIFDQIPTRAAVGTARLHALLCGWRDRIASSTRASPLQILERARRTSS